MEINMTFEQAIKRLEEIARMMEAGELPLEKSIELYAEGTKLSAYCNEKLSAAEQKITVLKESENKNE